MPEQLKYLSQKCIGDLYDNVEDNIEKYLTGNFSEDSKTGDWNIELSLKADLSPLNSLVLEKNSEAEIVNSMLVWKALHELSPSLACEDRVWSRLTHVDCLEYSRNRWLKGVSEKSLPDAVRKHFFANTQTRCRDDNAISRLWWNAYIAKLASPDNQEQAIRVILKTADIRSNFIERTRTTSRPALSSAIVRQMLTDPWVTEKERNFREFMIAINRLGGGKVFELWSENRIDEFLRKCIRSARQASNA